MHIVHLPCAKRRTDTIDMVELVVAEIKSDAVGRDLVAIAPADGEAVEYH